MKTVIEVKNIRKRYGNTEILSDVSFEAKEGRVTAFLGPNGAGKSTTLRILLGLDRQDAGSATVNGLRYKDLKRPLLTVGASFDGPGSPPDRRIYEHLHIVASSNGISRKRIPEVLSLTGIEHKKHSLIGNLSLGEGGRLGIATALLGDPDILILDEPTNGLDPAGIAWFRIFIKTQAKKGKTVLLSSHILSEVEAVTDDVVIIHKGRIKAQGELQSVLKNAPSLEDVFFSVTNEGGHNAKIL